jgi:hypothetical protein
MNEITMKMWVVTPSTFSGNGEVHICASESTAERLAKANEPTNAIVRSFECLLVNHRWYAPIADLPIRFPTREDIDADIERRHKHAAIEKAFAAGLTPKDLRYLGVDLPIDL